MKDSSITVRLATPDDQPLWDATVTHPLQSWVWGEFRKKMGIEVIRIIAEKKHAPLECYQISFHRIPKTPLTVGYSPKSPMPDKTILEAIREIGKQKHAVYIQFEPDQIKNCIFLPLLQSDKETTSDQIHADTSQSTHPIPTELRPSHRPLFTKYTFVLDISQSEEQLLKSMHPKTRYNIRVAQKHGVEIKEDDSKHAFEEYVRLSHATTQRQGFYAHNDNYHTTVWNMLHKANVAHLWTATYNNTVLATWIIFCWNDTLYYPYGASSRDHREVMAPNLMLWELIRWGKNHGYKKFDLWGALGPHPDTNDPWYGFHKFKEGYRPNLIEFMGSFDLVIHPILYFIYRIVDSIRWTLLKLKARRM